MSTVAKNRKAATVPTPKPFGLVSLSREQAQDLYPELMDRAREGSPTWICTEDVIGWETTYRGGIWEAQFDLTQWRKSLAQRGCANAGFLDCSTAEPVLVIEPAPPRDDNWPASPYFVVALRRPHVDLAEDSERDVEPEDRPNPTIHVVDSLAPDGKAICGAELSGPATHVIAADDDPRSCSGCVEAQGHRVPGLARLGGLLCGEVPPAPYDGKFGDRQKRAAVARDEQEKATKAANARAFTELLREGVVQR